MPQQTLLIYANDWNYTASGSANAVFEYTGNDTCLQHKVIRLRMDGQKINTHDIAEYMESDKFDELRKYFVGSDVYYVSTGDLMLLQEKIIERNIELRINVNENHVLLMNNLFSEKFSKYTKVEINKYYKVYFNKSENNVLFELKPKWLSDLPKSSKCCRNCLNAASKKQDFIYCHRKLLQGRNEIQSFTQALNRRLRHGGILVSDFDVSLADAILKNIDILITLKRLQNKLDIHQSLNSLNSISNVTEELLFNMTIRDVSVIYDLNEKSAYVIDLDKKPKEKWRAWKNQEQMLTGEHHRNSQSIRSK